MVCGPSLVVDRLLSLLECTSIATLVERFGIAQEHPQFRVVAAAAAGDPAPVDPVYRSVRVGLSLKAKQHDNAVLRMWSAPLRFVRQPHLLVKHKHLLALTMIHEGHAFGEFFNMCASRIDQRALTEMPIYAHCACVCCCS